MVDPNEENCNHHYAVHNYSYHKLMNKYNVNIELVIILT